MFDNLIEQLADIFENYGHSDPQGLEDLISNLGDLDLSQYSVEDVREALDAALDSPEPSSGHEITFQAAPDVDARNLAKSNLLDKLRIHGIHVYNVDTDKLWGGLDSSSGNKVYSAINDARDSGKISSSLYSDLIKLLKKACHSQ
jgi:hypothetical protein